MTSATPSVQTQRTSFSLLTEPWIPVVFQSLEYDMVSLKDLFLRWDDLKTVQAANPPRTIALWRWLIAFTQWSIQGPATKEDWAALWNDQELWQRIVEKLETVSDRLDLLHPKYPFAQCPDLLKEANGKPPTPAAKLLYHDKDTGLLWTRFSQWQPASLTYAEATQELLRLLCVDLGGTKSDKDKKERSAQSGSCMMARIVMPLGGTVKETLLLNLHEYNSSPTTSQRTPDLPLWEQGEIQKEFQKVNGLLDYLTFPGRRALLIHDDEKVVGVYIYRGEELSIKEPTPAQKSIIEANVSWEFWQAYVNNKPLNLDVHKASWRDAEALLHPTSDKNQKPRIFDWLVKCRKTKFVPDPLPVQVMGFAHENQKQGKPLQWVHDTMTIPQIYLDSGEAYHALVRALKYAEAVGELFSAKTYAPVADALNLSKPKGKKDNDWTRFIKNVSSISSSYWSALDAEFQQFMFDLTEDEEVDEDDDEITYGGKTIPVWKDKLRTIATDFYEQSLSGVSSYEAKARGLNAWHKELHKVLEK
ncbi:MAG: type I-E CRISPR-associated protein Cse1/CasA [Cyanobacteriota bacterium]|nr:type I-E CRISPR-associated protein Cse1/CasA [Cyanobacteriota bacterium]